MRLTSSTADNSDIKPLPKAALLSLKAHLTLWLTAAIGLLIDLITKAWALHALGDPRKHPPKPFVIIDNIFSFNTNLNDGAVWGFAGGKTAFLVLTSVLALGFLFWLFMSTRADQKWSHLAIGMLFAGALGNLHDRIFNDGMVVDFIEVNLHIRFANPWPTFNVADMLLCIGVLLLLLTMLTDTRNISKYGSK